MNTRLLATILSVLFLSLIGCSHNPELQPPVDKPSPISPTVKTPPSPKQVDLCGYRTIRGVAVVQKILSQKTLFNFYPGDWRVVMSNTEANRQLKGQPISLGNELKAELNEPVSGPCTQVKLTFTLLD